jgi:hypothetical protein
MILCRGKTGLKSYPDWTATDGSAGDQDFGPRLTVERSRLAKAFPSRPLIPEGIE